MTRRAVIGLGMGVATVTVLALVLLGASTSDEEADSPRRTPSSVRVSAWPTADTVGPPRSYPDEGPVVRTLPPGTTSITCVTRLGTVAGYIDIDPVDLTVPVLMPDSVCALAFPGSRAEISGTG